MAFPPPAKKKRSLPGNPDPEAEVIALSPKMLMATNRYLCEICGKGFQREQNLQLHRRGHNLPWKLKQRTSGTEPRKRVYVCPEKGCVHNHPSRALGDLTGIKKHFSRKHGEKKWKCDKCSKRYAVQSDWKAHSKTCGTREYRCDCGTIFSRRDSFITHRAFCDALAEETARIAAANSFTSVGGFNYQFTGGLIAGSNTMQHQLSTTEVGGEAIPGLSLWMGQGPNNSTTINLNNNNNNNNNNHIEHMNIGKLMYGDPRSQLDYQLSWLYGNKLSSPSSSEPTNNSMHLNCAKELESVPSLYSTQHQLHHHVPASDMSATALLQKAALIGVTSSSGPSTFSQSFDSKFDGLFNPNNIQSENNVQYLFQKDDLQRGGETRDFLGIGAQTLCASSIYQWVKAHKV